MQKYLIVILPLLFMLVQFSSCDILRLSPFEVSQWEPESGRYDYIDTISIFLEFSHEPDKSSVEKNFSMREEGSNVRGQIQWKGKRMNFIPFAPLERNRDYEIELSADARDTRGLSMDRTFVSQFSTRPDDSRPRLLELLPGMNSVIEDIRSPISLVFSREIPLNSLWDNVSFSPAMSGAWHSENGKAIFSPMETWSCGKRYEIRIAASLQADNGMAAGREYVSVFTIGTDTEKPYLIGAWRITKNGQEEKLTEESYDTFFDNSGWERTDRLRLVFSKPVDTLSVKNCLDTIGVSLPVMETVPGFTDDIIFGFNKPAVYDSRFSVILKNGVRDRPGNESEHKYVFKNHANGKYSMPPALVGIRIPLAPGNGMDPEPVSFGINTLFGDLPIVDGSERYPFTRETDTWIEVYFDTAPDTLINNFSLMELFQVNSSNNVITFSPRRIKTSFFSLVEPYPDWEEYQRVEIQGKLTNTVNSGIVYFEILPGLTDSRGNQNENFMRISLLK